MNYEKKLENMWRNQIFFHKLNKPGKLVEQKRLNKFREYLIFCMKIFGKNKGK